MVNYIKYERNTTNLKIENVDRGQFGDKIAKKAKKKSKMGSDGKYLKDENGNTIKENVKEEQKQIEENTYLNTILELRKYQVSPLGYISLVKKEKRLGTKKNLPKT
ncbi:MAG: hypothetical protein Ta2D_07870 [Rickettsiales bacterium]|nr:MAG: hypothetical protein Ta2D_07870 [Rickettsiales bacterium]